MTLQVKIVPIFPNIENETYKRHSRPVLIISLFAKKIKTKKIENSKTKNIYLTHFKKTIRLFLKPPKKGSGTGVFL